jgi:hypothetical protein
VRFAREALENPKMKMKKSFGSLAVDENSRKLLAQWLVHGRTMSIEELREVRPPLHHSVVASEPPDWCEDIKYLFEAILRSLMCTYGFLNVNPLPQLRKFFPQFEWRFEENQIDCGMSAIMPEYIFNLAEHACVWARLKGRRSQPTFQKYLLPDYVTVDDVDDAILKLGYEHVKVSL